MKNTLLIGSTCGLLLALGGSRLMADDSSSLNTRYGLFNGLDHRSGYGQGIYPEPFLVDDSDLERGEFRLDYLHTASGSAHTDIIHPEVEFGVGLLTLELEAPFERGVADGMTVSGMDNVDVGARYPLFQYVSKNGGVDTTFGVAAEVGIPTTSPVSHDTEIVPKIFNDTRVGNFSVQTIVGYSILAGPGDDGGLDTFEYGFVFGYDITHDTLPLPGIDKIIPVAELSGELPLNHDERGRDSLTADVGLRVNMKAIGRFQPRPGVVFVFPVDTGARADAHWGIITSLVVEF